MRGKKRSQLELNQRLLINQSVVRVNSCVNQNDSKGDVLPSGRWDLQRNGVEGVYEGKREQRGKEKRRKKEVRGRKVICSSIHGLRAEFHPSKVEIRVRVPVDALF